MAGSWAHMTTKSGKLRNNESFTGMIENGGDAYEAAEECYGMVQALAGELAQRGAPGGGGSAAGARWNRAQWILWARGHYREGIALGGRQREP